MIGTGQPPFDYPTRMEGGQPRGMMPAPRPMAASARVVHLFASPHDALVAPGGLADIAFAVNRPLRVERVDIHPKSARQFDVESGSIGGMVVRPVCLDALASSIPNVRFSPRAWHWAYPSLCTGETIHVFVRNISDVPARFRANLVGAEEMIP